MDDLISRQAAIDESFEIYVDGQKFEVVQVETLMGLPSATCDDCIWQVCNYNKIDWDAEPEEVYCPMASRACFANGKKVAWCLTCPYISEEDRELVKKAVEGSKPKTGKWKYTKFYTWECSQCKKNPTKGFGYVQSKDNLFDFCPNCGAKMKGETSE